MTRFVIVGAGEAGTRAALALRDAGAGEIVLIGEETDLPYERPPLSKLSGGSLTIRPIAASFAGIDARFGVAAHALDRDSKHVVLSDGGRLGYDRLLLATGARPRALSCDPEGVALSLRTRADAEAIFARARPGERAIIVGAGLIGLELAAELRKRGMAVTVLEAAGRALGRVLPQSIAEELVDHHVREGVRFLFDVSMGSIRPGRVGLIDGRELAGDLIIAATGVKPETTLAEAAGLECQNGIRVDAGLRTSDPDVFAAGDCAAPHHPYYGRFRFETWRNACDQGAMAARAMMGQIVTFAAHPWFWSEQYELGLQAVGLHDPTRTLVRRDLVGGGSVLFELDPEGVLCAAYGLGPGHAVAKDIRLAEMLIERKIRPPASSLVEPATSLKSLLRAA